MEEQILQCHVVSCAKGFLLHPVDTSPAQGGIYFDRSEISVSSPSMYVSIQRSSFQIGEGQVEVYHPDKG